MKNRLPRLAFIVISAFGIVSAQADDAAPAKTPPPVPPKQKWDSTLTAALTLTRGNSETLLAGLDATTQTKWGANELKLGLGGAYGETDTRTGTPGATTKTSTVNVNGIHAFGQYNRLFTERLFGLARVEGLHDDIAKIDYRVVLSPGAGYYLVKEIATKLSVEAGPSYVLERLGGKEDSFASLRVAENFSHEFNARAKMWQKTEVLPSVEDFTKVIVNTEIGISAALTEDKRLSLTATLNHCYDSQPAQDPTAPARMRNDTSLKTGITYTF